MSRPGDKCSGEWIKGSGGHRVHAPCVELATWTYPDDPHAYCDEHITAYDRMLYHYKKPTRRYLVSERWEIVEADATFKTLDEARRARSRWIEEDRHEGLRSHYVPIVHVRRYRLVKI